MDVVIRVRQVRTVEANWKGRSRGAKRFLNEVRRWTDLGYSSTSACAALLLLLFIHPPQFGC